MFYFKLVLIMSVLALATCSSVPEEFARQAALLNMQRDVVTGSPFQHVVYRNQGPAGKTLHVYLDGDGLPWIAGRPADDPTPRNLLVLKLMALDKAPAVYLGRPCYHGVTSQGECSSRFWLDERYSEAVVASLCAVIKQLLAQGAYQHVALFGHSGGGVLAVLLAARLPQTVAVVTVAANLNLEAWSAYTETNALTGSLNPASLPPLAGLIQQRHYAGAKDKIAPPALMATAAAHMGAELIILDAYDHVCCWEQVWPQVLADLEK
jgi:pimeloyl-ACP methyl ester carboxylesterase